MVLHPLNQLGILYTFYPVDAGLKPRWDELDSLVSAKTKAVMMVHFFGKSQDISAFQVFCSKHNLLLIDNNAHGHGGTFNGQPLGSFGDIGISSPRKILNTFSGGLLWLRNIDLKFILDLQPFPVSFKQHVKRKIFNSYPLLKNSIRKTLKNRPKYEDPWACRELVISDYTIDKWSKEVIEHTDWDKPRNTRQESYHRWQGFAMNNGLKPVFKELHPEAIPWCFPAYAKDQQEAIRWFDWGWENNVNIFSWPTLPKKIINENGSALKCWEKLICFSTEDNYKE